jgi:hypothetical protein
MTLCAGQAPEVSLAISAWATDLGVLEGKIVFPQISGNEFVAIGIPVGSQGEFPTTPELAATLAAQASGQLVQKVPRLFAVTPRDGLPQSARWEISLANQVRFVGSKSGARNASEVFVGSKDMYPLTAPRQWLPLVQQQPSFLVDVYPVPNNGESEADYRARSARPVQKLVVLKPGFFYQFEEASESSPK